MDLFDEVQPIWVVNDYLWDQLKQMSPQLAAMWPTTTPFFPVNDSTTGTSQWKGKPYFIYNQAFRVEHQMYQHKKSTFVYSMRASVDQLGPLSLAFQKIIDRQDDAAADVNEFNLSRKGTDKYCPVVFHSFELYQNEPGEPRDSSSAPYVISNFMVVSKYHLINE